MEAALGRKEQVNRCGKIDGDVEAQIIAIACTDPPTGHERWTLQLIADELVALKWWKVFRTQKSATRLKKRTQPLEKQMWCISKPGVEFVAYMEDVLTVYKQPYDPLFPVVCLDETNRQLMEEKRIPAKPAVLNG